MAMATYKGDRVKEIVEGRGAELVYLLPFSPDFNPIEQAFSEVKGLLRRAEAHPRIANRGNGEGALGGYARDARVSSPTAATMRWPNPFDRRYRSEGACGTSWVCLRLRSVHGFSG